MTAEGNYEHLMYWSPILHNEIMNYPTHILEPALPSLPPAASSRH